MKPRPDKLCGKGAGLTWSRRTVAGVVTWSLFRRDLRRAVHQFQVQLGPSAGTAYAAIKLREAKRRLRDQVDTIDLAAMERAA